MNKDRIPDNPVHAGMPLAVSSISILLHYYHSPDDHPDMSGDDRMTWFANRDRLKTEQLLEEREKDCARGPVYRLTARGECYVRGLLAVPLPVQEWRIPASIDRRSS